MCLYELEKHMQHAQSVVFERIADKQDLHIKI